MKLPLDVLNIQAQLREEEHLIDASVAAFAQDVLAPKVRETFASHASDTAYVRQLFQEMGAHGLLGMTLPEAVGGGGMSANAYGVAAFHIEGVDSGYRSAFSVQNSLVLHPIHAYGTADQHKEFLPKLIDGSHVGCFGLTEPGAGSDPAGMTTTARKRDGKWVLQGEKMWISNAPIADVFVIWAVSSEDNKVTGFVLPRNTPGLTASPIEGKLSLCASPTGSIALEDVVVSDDHRLPNEVGMRAPLGCLTKARFGIAWGALGAATACWNSALEYTMQRQQFQKPLAANQLIQWKLAEMQTEITLGLLGCVRLGELQATGQRIDPAAVSMLKRNSCRKSLMVARMARDMLGGNGIHGDYDVMRHMINLETVNTYEGTEDVHALVLGKAQTGINAFA